MTTTASTYFNQIREDFPQAGKNNDSQGFRDNFKNIKSAFEETDTAISDLKTAAVTVDQDNDFLFNVIRKATFQECVKKINPVVDTVTPGYFNVEYYNGSYQKFSVQPGVTTFAINWPLVTENNISEPVQGLSEITLALIPTSAEPTSITFAGATPVGNLTLPVESTDLTVKFFDLWYDGDVAYVSQRGV